MYNLFYCSTPDKHFDTRSNISVVTRSFCWSKIEFIVYNQIWSMHVSSDVFIDCTQCTGLGNVKIVFQECSTIMYSNRLFIIRRNFFLEKQNFLWLSFGVQIFFLQFSIFSCRFPCRSIVNAIFLRSTIIEIQFWGW